MRPVSFRLLALFLLLAALPALSGALPLNAPKTGEPKACCDHAGAEGELPAEGSSGCPFCPGLHCTPPPAAASAVTLDEGFFSAVVRQQIPPSRLTGRIDYPPERF